MIPPVENEIVIQVGRDYAQSYFYGSPSIAIAGSVPAGSSTVITLAGNVNPFAVDQSVGISGSPQAALNGTWTISAVVGMTLTVPATTAGATQAPLPTSTTIGYVFAPIDLTGATLASQIREDDNPIATLIATFTMTLAEDPTTGGFTETLLVAAQTLIPPRSRGEYRDRPFHYDCAITWPSGLTNTLKYGKVFAYPSVTVIG